MDATNSISAFYSGASDSVSVLPGSPASVYRYRFKQVDPPSDRFQFRDRYMSFYFRPTPGAIHFQVENLTDQPISIDWERSKFLTPYGRITAVAHQPSAWVNRYAAQSLTFIPGLARYSDYMFPMDNLVDPGSSGEQMHRPLLPEDLNAPQLSDATFGADMTFVIEDRPTTYNFRFKVASVLPR